MFSAGVTPTYISSYELHFVWAVISWLAVSAQQSICSHKWGLSLCSNHNIKCAGHCWLPHPLTVMCLTTVRQKTKESTSLVQNYSGEICDKCVQKILLVVTRFISSQRTVLSQLHRVVRCFIYCPLEQTSTNVSTDTRTTHTSNHDSTSSFKVYILKLMKIHVMWEVTPYQLSSSYWCFKKS
jgi:hypothetical protein